MTLGRIFNVLGLPVDQKGPVEVMSVIPFIALRRFFPSSPPALRFSNRHQGN